MEELFRELDVPVATRTTSAPALNEPAQAEFAAKFKALGSKYRGEFLEHD